MARLTVELLRPVPLAPLELKVRTFRPGKKVQWLEASLFDAEDREVARAAALRLRVDDVDTTGAVQPDPPSPPGPESVIDPGFPIGAALVGFWSANDVRIVGGSWTEPGPATAWFRLRCPVIAGEPLSSFARVAAAADFGSGVGNPVRFTHAAAINAEVTVHVHRHPVGEWVCLDSVGVGAAARRRHGRFTGARRGGSDRPRGADPAGRIARRAAHAQRARSPDRLRGAAPEGLVVLGLAFDVGGPQLELAVAVDERGRPARERRAEVTAAAVDPHRDRSGAPTP